MNKKNKGRRVPFAEIVNDLKVEKRQENKPVMVPLPNPNQRRKEEIKELKKELGGQSFGKPNRFIATGSFNVSKLG